MISINDAELTADRVGGGLLDNRLTADDMPIMFRMPHSRETLARQEIPVTGS